MSESILLDNYAILSKIISEKKKNKINSKKNIDVNLYENITPIILNFDEIEKNIKEDIDNCKLDDYISIDIKCNNCKSKNLIDMDGFNICNDCGLYNDCIIDCGQEWRFYGNDDSKGNDPSRCDIPTSELLPNTSIGSIVGFSSKDNKNSKRIRSMNFWNGFSYRDSSLLDTFNNITIISQNAGLSQCIIEEAKYMYKEVSEIKSSRRTKKESMKAGCIMLACKIKGVPRNCNEIASMFKLKNNKTFRKSIKTFEEIWKNIQLEKNITSSNSLINNNEEYLDNNIQKIDSKLYSKLYSKNSSNDTENEDTDTDTEDEDKEDEDKEDDDKEDEDKEDEDKEDEDKEDEDKKNKNINNEDTEDDNTEDKDIKDKDKDTEDKDKDTEDEDTEDEETNDNDKIIQECITKLHRFSCSLGLSDRVFELCKLILIYIEKNKYLEKHTPLSRTSTIIYYVIERLNITINKYHILQTCEISQVTINKCYQKLMKYKSELENIKI